MRFNTALLHQVEKGDKETGATLTPIYHSSAFYQSSAEQHEKLFHNKANGFSYTRINNPTILAFENEMTALEGGIASVACASGMAAITNALLNVVRAGEEILASTSLYGGSIDVFHDFEAFGIKTVFVDIHDEQAVEAAINEKTRVIFAETIGNPKLDVVDIEKLAETAHKHNLPLVMDNTVATAYLVRPIEKGADIVVNSTSKYINANSDAISGVITDSGAFRWDKEKYPGMAEYAKFGKFAFTAKLRNGLFRNTGACLSPQTAFYNLLGMETLGLRMERACDNAKKLAEFLNTYPDVTVNYPGLSDSLWHAQAEKVLQNGYGAILTIRVGSKERAFGLINTLTIPKIVSNIGDTKTLIIHPESTLNAQQTALDEKTAQLKDQQAQIDQIIGVKADVIEALKNEFSKNNINVDIDAQTGALTLEASVMFDYDQAELTDSGKQALEQILPIYCKVLLQDDYKDYLAEIIIDGYTDTDGDYSYNLQLSQQRSLAVAQYLIDIQGNFLNDEQSQELEKYLTVNGHSMANPVLDANGNVDKDASRRVEVKFRLKDEEMIDELNQLLSGTDSQSDTVDQTDAENTENN